MTLYTVFCFQFPQLFLGVRSSYLVATHRRRAPPRCTVLYALSCPASAQPVPYEQGMADIMLRPRTLGLSDVSAGRGRGHVAGSIRTLVQFYVATGSSEVTAYHLIQVLITLLLGLSTVR